MFSKMTREIRWKQRFHQFYHSFIKGSASEKLSYSKNIIFKLFPSAFYFEEKKFKKRLENYINLVSIQKPQHFILMYSGTPPVENFQGNRPVRLTKEFIGLQLPVFFSYWRWNTKEAIPSSKSNILFQSPIDLTIKYFDEIAKNTFNGIDKILIISFPHDSCIPMIKKLRDSGWRIMYDIRDDWEEFNKVGQAEWYKKNIEQQIIADSDIVYAVSRPLISKLEKFAINKKILLVPNALDYNFYSSAPFRTAPKNGDIVIGYIGHLTDAWFDWNAILKIADDHPEWKIELIGHSIPKYIQLPNNIKYLGKKTHDEIIRFTETWRVAIIPFKISTLSDGVDPIKVYEYLALGIPVVSFRMPQIKSYPYVFVANNIKEFQECIEKALVTHIDRSTIDNFLRQNLWRQRATQIIRLESASNKVSE